MTGGNAGGQANLEVVAGEFNVDELTELRIYDLLSKVAMPMSTVVSSCLLCVNFLVTACLYFQDKPTDLALQSTLVF